MRSLFLLNPDVVFLNHGSFGACPREVLQAQFEWQLRIERNPVEFLARSSAPLLLEARTTLAHTLGTSAQNLVFLPNATTGVHMVAHSFPLQTGDEVLSTNLEYGACDTIWQRVCAQRGAHYRRVEVALPFSANRFVEELMAHVTPRTRLIFLSHISSSTALTLPVARVCAAARQLGIATLVDGAHAPGHIALNIDHTGADFYVGNCHKWLCAPRGSGFVVARPDMQHLLEAPVVSWGYSAAAQNNPLFEACLGTTPFEKKLQWQGTRDLSAWLAVPAAIAFQANHNWPQARTQCHTLARQALHTLTHRHGLEPISEEQDWAQMVAIPVRAESAETLQARLYAESRVEVPVTTHGNHVLVRLSVQAYNTEEDIERLLNAPALL